MQYIHKPPDGKQEERSNFHRKKKFANQKKKKKILEKMKTTWSFLPQIIKLIVFGKSATY